MNIFLIILLVLLILLAIVGLVSIALIILFIRMARAGLESFENWADQNVFGSLTNPHIICSDEEEDIDKKIQKDIKRKKNKKK